MRKFSVRIEHGNKKGVKICDGFCKEGSRITTSANRCVLFNVLRNKFYLNFNGLNAAIKRHRVAGWRTTCVSMHSHLPHHST